MAKLPPGEGVRLVTEKLGLIALDKPAGVRSHPNKSGSVDQGALVLAPYDLEQECYLLEEGPLYLLNRLDGPTSGLILLTRKPEVAREVRALFAAHRVEKTYQALVFGRVGRLDQTWRDRLQVKRGQGGLRTQAGQGDLSASKVRSMGSGGKVLPLSLLQLKPLTGRTHQLRVQCAQRRLPIVGDATYGDFALNKRAARELGIKRLCLHSSQVCLTLTDTAGGAQFTAECPAPAEFKLALSAR